MTWRSTIPAAMDGLKSLIDATDIRVVVGPVFSDTSMATTVVIGWGGTGQDSAIVTAASDLDGYSTNPTRESYTIRCVAVADSGATSAEAVTETRDRALEAFGAVASAVAADKTLGGVVMLANIADYSLTIQQTSRGLTAFVEFGVAVEAQSRRS